MYPYKFFIWYEKDQYLGEEGESKNVLKKDG